MFRPKPSRLRCSVLSTTSGVVFVTPCDGFRKPPWMSPLPDPPSEGLLRCLIISGVVLLRCWRSELTLFSSLLPPLGQASLTRAVLLLQLRFYSHLIPLWGVRYTSPSGGRLPSGFGGGVCFLLGGLHHTRSFRFENSISCNPSGQSKGRFGLKITASYKLLHTVENYAVFERTRFL